MTAAMAAAEGVAGFAITPPPKGHRERPRHHDPNPHAPTPGDAPAPAAAAAPAERRVLTDEQLKNAVRLQPAEVQVLPYAFANPFSLQTPFRGLLSVVPFFPALPPQSLG